MLGQIIHYKPEALNSTNPLIFLLTIFAKFQAEQYDFNLCKGFSFAWKEMAQIFQIKKKKNSPDFNDKFHMATS
jgi:hypothetical protein